MSRRRGHERARRRVGAATAALLLTLGVLPWPALAVTPTDGPPLTLLPVPINNDLGDQYDPHVSGGLASYTAGNTIRYYSFLGSDNQVPAPTDAFDQLSDVSNGRIVFSRVDASFAGRIVVFDTVTSSTSEVDPQTLPIRSNPAIGADTVAFIDLALTVGGELFASGLAGGGTKRVTTDTRVDQEPSVSPLGDRIVWESCASTGSNCDIYEATLIGGTWTPNPLTTNLEPEANPDTDGATVVYDANRSGERDIRWQPVGGGTEGVLELAGEQRNPSISAGVVLYESVAVGETAADLWVYEIATNRRFRITTTPGLDENLNDISSLGGGMFRIVWSSGAFGDRDVFGATFTIPPVGPPSADKILFMSTRHHWAFEVYSMEDNGNSVTRLTNNTTFDGLAVWSPDRTRIAFVSTRHGNFEIYTMDADGNNVVRRTNNSRTDLSPSWSPDGTRLVFSSDRSPHSGNFEIYTMRVDGPGLGTEVYRRTNNGKTDITPAWSPTDPTQIAFSSDRSPANNYEIWTMTINPLTDSLGAAPMNRTNNSRTDVLPAWAPDGLRIALSSDRSPHSGNFEIYTMNANGTGSTRLTTNSRIDTTPAYSSDGTRIWFSSNRLPAADFEIYSMGVSGEPPAATNLTNNPAFDTLAN